MAMGRRPKIVRGFKRTRKSMPSNYFKSPSDGKAPSPPALAESALPRREEGRLLRAARGGDAAALRALLQHVSRPAFRYGLSFCKDRQDAEEIAQDVLASLVRSLESYRGEASLSTWAYTVARNACIRRRRRAQPGIESLDAWSENGGREPADPSEGPDAAVERGEIRAALQAELKRLPADLREAVILRDVEGLSAREAAAVLRITERAFKSRLHRGRLRLRDALEPLVRAADPAAAAPADARGAAARLRSGDGSGFRRCPDVARYLSLHHEGDVDRSLCARLEAHVRACPSCAATCRSLRATLRACRLLRSTPIPRSARAALRRALAGAGTDSAARG
jgi:RNA polymerase sigma-70 factor (ECF subfamily)